MGGRKQDSQILCLIGVSTGVVIDTSVDCRPPYRSTYWLGVDPVATECQSSIRCVSVTKQLTYRPIISQPLVDRSTDSRLR